MTRSHTCTCDEIQRLAGYFCTRCKRNLQRDIAPDVETLEQEMTPPYRVVLREVFRVQRAARAAERLEVGGLSRDAIGFMRLMQME